MPAPVLETLTRRAALAPSSLDTQSGTVDATISTFADRTLRDGRGTHLERLDPAGLDSSRLIGAPVLDGHRQGSARDVIGVVESVRTEIGALVATIRLSAAPDVASTVQKIREGTIRGVSVGYVVTRWIESTDPQTRQRIKTAAAWQIREVSAVAVPADPGATFRSDQMPKDNIEDGRAGLIARVAAAHNLPEDWQTRMESAGDEISDDEIRADGRETAIAIRAARPPVTIRTTGHNATTTDDPANLRRAMTEAITGHLTGERPTEGAARDLAGFDWQEMQAEYLRRSGHRITGFESMTRALGTSDLPLIAGDAVGISVRRSYEAAASPIVATMGSRTLPDFRPVTEAMVDWTTLSVDKVSEQGEFKHSYVDETGETYRLFTIGGITDISRYAYINGGGALANMSQAQGRRLAADVADRAVAYLEQATHAGPTMADGNPVFHASRGNIEELDTVSVNTVIDSLLAARSAMPKRKGKGDVMIGRTPSLWLVPTEFEPTAIRALASVTAAEAGNVNPLAGRLTIVTEPRLTDAATSYLIADPATMDGFVRGSLAGQPGPMTESRWGFEVDAIQFKIRLDLALAFLEWRGWTRLDHISG
ncbi:HK97 family phage prohead protease [Pseudooceanicola atlanticus]|uniref:phage major capsid protein n=1 Tax=Pseudooceanicola atlanticus TaxID=1461694 RepID=UPI0023541E14|nr:HK97 family phage prohead protease [Pseudooceanicola atlanticus]